jgi:hypothetical protein
MRAKVASASPISLISLISACAHNAPIRRQIEQLQTVSHAGVLVRSNRTAPQWQDPRIIGRHSSSRRTTQVAWQVDQRPDGTRSPSKCIERRSLWWVNMQKTPMVKDAPKIAALSAIIKPLPPEYTFIRRTAATAATGSMHDESTK